MVKRISLTVADDVYEKLAVLSDYYKVDIQETIRSILETISIESRWIADLKKYYKVPVSLTNVMMHVVFAAFHSLGLFNKVLEKMDVKGLYTLDDFESSLDENYLWFYYNALIGCKLHVHEFDLTIKPGLKTLTTYSHINIEKLDKQILGKLKELVNSIEASEWFDYLEDYNIEIEEEEEFWTLTIDCTADSLDNLPSVREVSRFVGQIFKKVGLKI